LYIIAVTCAHSRQPPVASAQQSPPRQCELQEGWSPTCPQHARRVTMPLPGAPPGALGGRRARARTRSAYAQAATWVCGHWELHCHCAKRQVSCHWSPRGSLRADHDTDWRAWLRLWKFLKLCPPLVLRCRGHSLAADAAAALVISTMRSFTSLRDSAARGKGRRSLKESSPRVTLVVMPKASTLVMSAFSTGMPM